LLNNEVCYKLDPDYASISLRIGQGIAGRVAHSGQPKIIPSYRRVLDQVEIHKGTGFGSVVAVPFTWKGEVKGVLELIRAEDAPQFIQDDVELVGILANQAAIALENARLLQEAQDKAAQLGTLNEVNRMISATLDRDAALKLITDTAVMMLQTEAGSIFLADERGQSLTFEIAHGPSGTQLIGITIPIDEHSIAGSIALSKKAMIVNDVASDPRWNTSFDETSKFRTRDILGVPMIAFGRVVGVIELLNKRDGRGFNENDLATLDIFVQQAAVAIVNAKRFTETDQALSSRMQELNTLHMIDRELIASLDLDMVLDLSLSRTLDAFWA
jgi:GAF domain-containing protein